jgi:3-hydroxybutyryl-CoA dehydratase
VIIRIDDNFTQTYTVSEFVYNKFIELFNDRNPLHTNEEFARSKKFKERVMHGNILNGFLSHFIGECLPDKNVIIHSQQIQFKKPVYLNDTLTLNVTASDVFESVNAVEFKFSFVNEQGTVVAQGKIQIGII